jgi:hypothetical protein
LLPFHLLPASFRPLHHLLVAETSPATRTAYPSQLPSSAALAKSGQLFSAQKSVRIHLCLLTHCCHAPARMFAKASVSAAVR